MWARLGSRGWIGLQAFPVYLQITLEEAFDVFDAL